MSTDNVTPMKPRSDMGERVQAEREHVFQAMGIIDTARRAFGEEDCNGQYALEVAYGLLDGIAAWLGDIQDDLRNKGGASG